MGFIRSSERAGIPCRHHTQLAMTRRDELEDWLYSSYFSLLMVLRCNGGLSHTCAKNFSVSRSVLSCKSDLEKLLIEARQAHGTAIGDSNLLPTRNLGLPSEELFGAEHCIRTSALCPCLCSHSLTSV